MAKLTTRARKAIPKSDFALPDKRSKSGGKGGYPIEDKAHARNALARVSEFGTPAQKAEVRAKVEKKYPGMGDGKKKGAERDRGRRSDKREGRR
jgi:hypothetical protein